MSLCRLGKAFRLAFRLSSRLIRPLRESLSTKL